MESRTTNHVEKMKRLYRIDASKNYKKINYQCTVTDIDNFRFQYFRTT